MSDTTAGQTWTQRLQYQSGLTSAEWILEAPYSNGVLPLNDYVQQTFDPVAANGANPNLSLTANSIVMQDGWGQTSNPSSPALGQWFSTCYGAGTTLTPFTSVSFTPPPSPAPTDGKHCN